MGRIRWSDLQPLSKGQYKKWKNSGTKSISSKTMKSHLNQGAKSGNDVEKALEVKWKLEEDATSEETKILAWLKESKVRYEFQKIYYIGITFIVADFLIEGKYVLEIDGGQHFKDNKLAEDKNRDNFFKKRGYTVTRISNYYIRNLDKRQFFNFLDTIRKKQPEKLPTYYLKDILKFGKHLGKSVEEIAILDRSYLVWMYRTRICTFEKGLMQRLKLA